MLRTLIIFCYSCRNFKGRNSFRESGQRCILKALHCSSSPEVLDCESRHRLKTITMTIHLTTFCRSTTYFVFIFHGHFATCFHLYKCPGINGAASWRWATALSTRSNMRRVARFFFRLFCSAVSFCSQYLCKGGEQKIFLLDSYLPAKPTADQKWLGPNG